MSPGCPTKLILVEFLPCFPGSALAGRDPLAPWCHTWSRTSATAVTQPRSWAGPAEHRDSALSAGEFMSCRCLPSAENTSGKCGSEIFPQLPRPCCERPCSRRPSLEGPAGLGAAAGSGTGCLIKKGKLLPAEAAHSRLGHVGSTSIYSPFSPSQGSGSELPAWQLSCSFPTLTSTILNPFLCPGALSGGGDHPPPPAAQTLAELLGTCPIFSPFRGCTDTSCFASPRGRGCRRLSRVRSFSLLHLVARPHWASSGQIRDNRAVFRNGQQIFGSASPQSRACWVSSPTVGSPGSARCCGAAPRSLLHRLALSWKRNGAWHCSSFGKPPAGSSPAGPACSCPGMRHPSSTGEGGCPELGPQDLLEVAAKCHPMQGCRSPRKGGNPGPVPQAVCTL